MKVEIPVSNSPYGLCGRKATLNLTWSNRAEELCESRGGLCGCKATLNEPVRVQELCESRGGQLGYSSLIVLMVSERTNHSQNSKAM